MALVAAAARGNLRLYLRRRGRQDRSARACAGASAADLRMLFVNLHVHARPVQRRPQRETGNASADEAYPHGLRA